MAKPGTWQNKWREIMVEELGEEETSRLIKTQLDVSIILSKYSLF